MHKFDIRNVMLGPKHNFDSKNNMVVPTNVRLRPNTRVVCKKHVGDANKCAFDAEQHDLGTKQWFECQTIVMLVPKT